MTGPRPQSGGERITETQVVACVLRAGPFHELMNRLARFRSRAFEGYSRRITMLMSKIEELLCTRIDMRMAERLLALEDDKHRISTNRQDAIQYAAKNQGVEDVIA